MEQACGRFFLLDVQHDDSIDDKLDQFLQQIPTPYGVCLWFLECMCPALATPAQLLHSSQRSCKARSHGPGLLELPFCVRLPRSDGSFQLLQCGRLDSTMSPTSPTTAAAEASAAAERPNLAESTSPDVSGVSGFCLAMTADGGVTLILPKEETAIEPQHQRMVHRREDAHKRHGVRIVVRHVSLHHEYAA